MPDLIQAGTAHAYTVPTDAPEADGTFAWDSTTLVLVTLSAGPHTGLGYTYTHKVAAPLARDLIQKAALGADPLDPSKLHGTLRTLERNYGTGGIAATALSAIDLAAWDLKAKLLGVPLATLLGRAHSAVPVYGSGGFTTYTDSQLTHQLAGWVEDGIPRVKIKIGTHPGQDPHRVAVARGAIGAVAELFVDANGAYAPKQALALAHRFAAEQAVTWFEEPVSSDNLPALAHLRQSVPAPMEIAAGEYGWDLLYFERMLGAAAVDVLQADATRCGGATGFLAAAHLAQAHQTPLSAHCAPSLHRHLCCASPTLRHCEYFHDHARIEQLFFDGFAAPVHGSLSPDLTRPGFGLHFKSGDAAPFLDNI